jgi:putative Holliday junction resolvase
VPRILAIDYGKKRTGIAVTDPLQLIATALDTVDTQELFAFLKAYCKREAVEQFVIGDPRNLDDSDTHATPLVRQCIARLQKEFPDIPVVAVDERFSSKRARQAMLDMGMKKKERQKKANVDQIAAALLLQEYLESRGNNNIPIN